MTSFKTWAEMTITERRKAMVSVMDADPANATGTAGTKPYEPWSEKIMAVTGHGAGHGWLFLCCRDCGWYLGYSPQYGLKALAAAGEAHADECVELDILAGGVPDA